jgi:hypothetical protein
MNRTTTSNHPQNLVKNAIQSIPEQQQNKTVFVTVAKKNSTV